MDFLTSLYSNENFGIILFTSVSILVLAFLIILFFGKKDQKERNLAKEQTNNENTNETDSKSEVAFDTIEPLTSVEIPENKETSDFFSAEQENPITLKETEKEENIVESEEEEEIKEELIPPKSDFDFDALAASISKELESIGISEDTFIAEPNQYQEINDITNQEDTNMEVEKEKVETNLNLYEPPKQMEPTVELKLEPDDKNSDLETVAMPNPTQFSSVYVNTKSEQEETSESNSKPPMELPKKIELPKLNSEALQKQEQETPNMMFPSLENEIPDYQDENRM